MKTWNIIRLSLFKIGSWPWTEREKAITLLDIFEKYRGKEIRIDRYGTSELRTSPLEGSIERFLETWKKKRYCIFKSKKPWKITVPVMMYPTGVSYISVHMEDRFFKTNSESKTNAFLGLAKRLYEWGDIDYGYIANEDEFKDKNVYSVGPHTIRGGGRLDQALPGIYWANFFGPRYVEWFGKEKFETSPAFYKEELEDRGWMILTRLKPIDMRGDSARQLERAIIAHLGENAFFDKSQPKRHTISPKFAQREVSNE
jgi:hypothetical protein